MSIIRIEKKANYSVISNDFLNDPQLSFQQKGLLAYLLTKPDHWQINVKHLITTSTDGRDTIYKTIEKLIEAGYVIRQQTNGKNGKFTTFDYKVFESKQLPLPENPEPDEPETGNPDISNNLLLLNTELSKNTEPLKKTNKEIIQEKKKKFVRKVFDWNEKNPGKYPKRMFVDFVKYWAEEEKNGSPKIRHDEQKFFDVGKRLSTWFDKAGDGIISAYWQVENKISSLGELFTNYLNGK